MTSGSSRRRQQPRFPSERVGFAAETYVLSLLLRCGFNAALTMGTTKAVDLIAIASNGRTITVDVKGACVNEDFLLGSRLKEHPGHFYVLVFFGAGFAYPPRHPEVYVLPAERIREVMTARESSVNVSGARLRKSAFKDAWSLLGSP